MICRKCGTENKKDSIYCKECGERLNKSEIKKFDWFKTTLIVLAVIAVGAVLNSIVSPMLKKNVDYTQDKHNNLENSIEQVTDAYNTEKNVEEGSVLTTEETESLISEVPLEDKYKIVNGEYDWEEAQQECERMGGHLVWINDYKEWKYLTKTFIPNQKNAGVKFLVGGRRSEDSHNYYWTDGYEAFGNVLNSQDSWINKHDLWFYSAIQIQPSFYDSETEENEYYLQLFYIKDTSSNREKGRKIGWSFNDVSISEKMSFICEFE